jgi:CheY-like chemotaxis protein
MPKIAICDDEQPIREYLKSLTEKCIPDSQVRLFGSGEALLRDQTSFDVILLDVI